MSPANATSIVEHARRPGLLDIALPTAVLYFGFESLLVFALDLVRSWTRLFAAPDQVDVLLVRIFALYVSWGAVPGALVAFAILRWGWPRWLATLFWGMAGAVRTLVRRKRSAA